MNSDFIHHLLSSMMHNLGHLGSLRAEGAEMAMVVVSTI